jgi:hypothetical protein
MVSHKRRVTHAILVGLVSKLLIHNIPTKATIVIFFLMSLCDTAVNRGAEKGNRNRATD